MPCERACRRSLPRARVQSRARRPGPAVRTRFAMTQDYSSSVTVRPTDERRRRWRRLRFRAVTPRRDELRRRRRRGQRPDLRDVARIGASHCSASSRHAGEMWSDVRQSRNPIQARGETAVMVARRSGLGEWALRAARRSALTACRRRPPCRCASAIQLNQRSGSSQTPRSARTSACFSSKIETSSPICDTSHDMFAAWRT
jgi:hypothetical protein